MVHTELQVRPQTSSMPHARRAAPHSALCGRRARAELWCSLPSTERRLTTALSFGCAPSPDGRDAQLEALGKDQQRIESMRARNEARRERFLNARQRAIGIDTDSLDQQVLFLAQFCRSPRPAARPFPVPSMHTRIRLARHALPIIVRCLPPTSRSRPFRVGVGRRCATVVLSSRLGCASSDAPTLPRVGALSASSDEARMGVGFPPRLCRAGSRVVGPRSLIPPPRPSQ